MATLVFRTGWQYLGASFHDFAGSVVVHGMGGWIALAAVVLLVHVMVDIK